MDQKTTFETSIERWPGMEGDHLGLGLMVDVDSSVVDCVKYLLVDLF